MCNAGHSRDIAASPSPAWPDCHVRCGARIAHVAATPCRALGDSGHGPCTVEQPAAGRSTWPLACQAERPDRRRTLMKTRIAFGALLALLLAAPAFAEVSWSVGIGINSPPPPVVVYRYEPRWVYVPEQA